MPTAILAEPMNSTETTRTEGGEVSLQHLLEVSRVVLQQAVDLVDDDLTSDDQLTVHSQYMPGSTIGARRYPLCHVVANPHS